MTNEEFKATRAGLGASQAALSDYLGYGSPVRISELERTTNPRPVPVHLGRLMKAYRDGYRPDDWPFK